MLFSLPLSSSRACSARFFFCTERCLPCQLYLWKPLNTWTLRKHDALLSILYSAAGSSSVLSPSCISQNASYQLEAEVRYDRRRQALRGNTSKNKWKDGRQYTDRQTGGYLVLVDSRSSSSSAILSSRSSCICKEIVKKMKKEK